MRSLLRTHHVAVVCIESQDRQGVINWKTLANISPSRQIQQGICDIAHEWTIFIGIMCQKPDGSQHLYSEEYALQGVYRSRDLSDPIEAFVQEVKSRANPNHYVSAGWIAMPYKATIEAPQASKIFAAIGGWQRMAA